MHRLIKTTAVVFAGALLLSGCAASGGSDSSASADPCEVVRVEVRNISNGAQNTLATATDADATVEYLDGLEKRVSDLSDKAGDDSKLADALDGVESALESASEYAATISADVDQDADALAAQQAAVQDAATKISEVCAAK